MQEVKNARPNVSIIIPTKNRKNFLMVAVQSILQQTYQDFEIIVHDNHSSDGTGDELRRRFADPRLRYYRVDEDLTMQQNWNAAFQYVTGSFFLRLDDDNCLLKDFLECALREIRQHHLAVMTFSALTVHLGNKLYCTFDEEQRTHLLNKYQLAYLEYFALTDSNCTVYDVSMLRTLFPDGNIYQADLPDRYLSYCIAGRMDELGLKIGFSTILKDVTRYDHRSYLPAGFQLTYVPYMTDRMKQTDPKQYSFNFSLYRVNTLRQFMEKTTYRDIQLFFEKAILSKHAYQALIFFGHLSRTYSAYSLKEFIVYVRYVLSVDAILLKRIRMAVEGERAGAFLVTFSLFVLQGVLQSLRNILFGKKREPNDVNISLGDEIIATVLRGRDLSHYKSISLRGNAASVLSSIDQRVKNIP